ncbi:MAG: TIGR04211 family SH3 domain-containing protein [Pseudomonadota bacterium]|nr:TIGR04211 family SH3 domain-containing protein [Pseudomonadota bacterium]
MGYRLFIVLIIVLFLLPSNAWAATRYVSDQLEITLRSGASNQHRILKMLDSGMALQVLEQNDTGWSKVRTPRGDEGWVLSRYLMNGPSARSRLERAEREVQQLQTTNETLTTELNALKQELSSTREHLKQTTGRSEELAEKLDTASEGLKMAQTNQTLRQDIARLRMNIQTLEQQTERLADRSRRDWFLAGAAVLIAGLFLGLVLPRLNFRRKKRWDTW